MFFLRSRYMHRASPAAGAAERLAASRAHLCGGLRVSERSPSERIGGGVSEPKRSNAHATHGPRSSHLALDRKRDALNCALHYSEDTLRICRLLWAQTSVGTGFVPLCPSSSFRSDASCSAHCRPCLSAGLCSLCASSFCCDRHLRIRPLP